MPLPVSFAQRASGVPAEADAAEAPEAPEAAGSAGSAAGSDAGDAKSWAKSLKAGSTFTSSGSPADSENGRPRPSSREDLWRNGGSFLLVVLGSPRNLEAGGSCRFVVKLTQRGGGPPKKD